MMLIRPSRGVWNLIGIRGGCENLRQQWIRIQRHSLHQPVQFLRRIGRRRWWRRLTKSNGRKSREGEGQCCADRERARLIVLNPRLNPHQIDLLVHAGVSTPYFALFLSEGRAWCIPSY